MRSVRSLLALSATLGCLACGGDGGTGPTTPTAPSFESIAGTYNGALSGTTQGIALNAVFTIDIGQSSGTLSGRYAMAGALNDGVSSVDVAGAGDIAGSIASGSNPSVNITFHSDACPGDADTFSGAYDSVNHKLTISGSVNITDVCGNTVLSYPTTVILVR